jgi:hypothetical protein
VTRGNITPCRIPDDALLTAYSLNGGFADCYAVDIAGSISLERYVEAFYTTRVFKIERLILKYAVSLPSTDDEARQLAAGTIDRFAAWHVEARRDDQLLLCDFQRRTRSWLMVAPAMHANGPQTRLYFGSGVVAVIDRKTGVASQGRVFRALLGFHKVYSKVLLHAARSRLQRSQRNTSA